MLKALVNLFTIILFAYLAYVNQLAKIKMSSLSLSQVTYYLPWNTIAKYNFNYVMLTLQGRVTEGL